MKRIVAILVFTGICSYLSAENNNPYTPSPVKLKQRPLSYVKQRIVKIIDGKDDSFCFVFNNHRKKVFEIYNNFFLYYVGGKHSYIIKNSFYKKRKKVSAMKKIVFSDNLRQEISQDILSVPTYFSLAWIYIDKFNKKNMYKYIYFIKQKHKVSHFISWFTIGDTKKRTKYEIAKLLDKKCLSFAFVVSNPTKNINIVPEFLSPNSRIKIKFPDGKIYTYYEKGKNSKTIQLKPGESKFVKVDIEQILGRSTEYSMKNFDYGMSELIWEVNLPDNSKISKIFYLLKTEKPLPEIAKTKGYLMDVRTPLK